MSTPLDPPPGDSTGLFTAAKGPRTIAADLTNQLEDAKKAVAGAKADWRGPRADDFEHAGQALIDELAMMVTATDNAGRILSDYATELQTITTDVAANKTRYDNAEADNGPDHMAIDHVRSDQWQKAVHARSALHAYALKAIAALDTETALAVPKASTLSPDEIARKVNSSLGFTLLTDPKIFITGPVNDDEAWAILDPVGGPVYDPDAPVPGDTGYQAWYAALTGAQQLLEAQKLQKSFDPKDFDPYKSIQGGQVPPWATRFNNEHPPLCYPDGTNGRKYGYFGGGTIQGPGGKQWPIVMPYYSDGKVTYMADSGGGRADGGIDQMDGKDPGWQTVSVYSDLGTFGSISTSTKVITAGLILSGQHLRVRPVDPDAVKVDAAGVPHAGHDVKNMPAGAQGEDFWGVDSRSMMPKPLENLPPRSIQANLEYNQAALGADALAVQTLQAGGAVRELEDHAKRQWYVEYQINTDGRTRAVVRTYTAGPLEDGKTGVLGLANAFPTGQSGSTDEIPYKTRVNPDTNIPAYSAQQDQNVVYSNQNPDPPPNLGPGGHRREKLTK